MKTGNIRHIIPALLIGLTGLCMLGSCKKKDMSMKMNEPRNIRGVISYKRSFGDLNPKHLKIAQAIGVPPIASRKEAEFAHSLHPLPHSRCSQLARHHRSQLPRLTPGKRTEPQPGNRHFRVAYPKRCETIAPPQYQRLSQFVALLWHHFRHQLETL